MSDRDRYGYDRGPRRSSMGPSEEPPNSRLFIIGPKTLTEDGYQKAFCEFGHIEELWVVKDRQTGESKGVTYIKYSKTSEAARAMEEMNGKTLPNSSRSIKIMVAASRDQGSKRDLNEEEKTLRLFVLVPKDLTDNELYDHFKKFGEIDYANIIRDKHSKESKGFAYVKYFKFLHAALAYEQCDKKYKPVFAEPRKPNVKEERHNSSFSSIEPAPSRNSSFSSSSMGLLPPPVNHMTDRYTKLKVIASPQVNQDQLWKLFDIIPGMDYCVLKYDEEHNRPTRAIGEVVYTNAQWAAHAVDKLHGFEYPPGFRLIVKPDHDGKDDGEKPKQELLRIAETIAQATQLIKAAGLSPDLLSAKLGLGSSGMETESICNKKLPDPQPLADIDSSMAARCFIVCSPTPLPNSVLRDVFCRFGDLIEVYLLGNKNCGYAKFASKSSAERAIATLHGAEVMGIRLKVLEAEERSDHQRKRMKTDDD